jgi:phage FluMu gp28-like protein
VGIICDEEWGASALASLSPSLEGAQRSGREISGPLYAGIDVGRLHDRTVITVLEKCGSTYIVRAILRLSGMRLPDQQQRLEQVLALPNLQHAKIDMTGLGLGLFEYTHQKFARKIIGVNFASSISIDSLPTPFKRPFFNTPKNGLTF